MYTVYAAYNKKHHKIYIGQTESLDVRMTLHNNKVFKKSYTSRFDEGWSLIYTESYNSRAEALIREGQFKSYRGREFIKTYIRE